MRRALSRNTRINLGCSSGKCPGCSKHLLFQNNHYSCALGILVHPSPDLCFGTTQSLSSGRAAHGTLVITYSKPTQSLKEIHTLNQHNAKGYSVFQEFLHLFIPGFLLQQALLPGNLVKEVGLILIQPPHHVLCHHENRDAQDGDHRS